MMDDQFGSLPDPEKQDFDHFQAILKNAQTNLEVVDMASDYDRYRGLLIHYAELLIKAGRFEEARQKALEALNLDRTSRVAARALLVLAECAIHKGELEQADLCYQEAQGLSHLLNDDLILTQVILEKVRMIYIRRGQFDLALSYIVNTEVSEKKDAGWKSLFLTALIHLTTGNRIKTRQALDEMLPMVQPGSEIACAYHYIWACLTLDQEELEKALEYLQLAFRLANQAGTPDLYIWVRIEFSRYFRLRDNFPVARVWAQDGYKYAKQIGSRFLVGQTLVELAQIASCEGNIKLALDQINEAIRLFEPIEAKYEWTRANFLKAAFCKQHQCPDAEAMWTLATEQITQGGYAFLMEREREIAFPLISAHLRSKDTKARKAAETLMQQITSVPPPALRIFGLGKFQIWQGRRRIQDSAWQRRKAGELFRYLLLKSGYSAGRDEILEDLWGEHSPDNAQDLFHQSTSTLRHILEPDLPEKFPSRYLAVEGERVYLLLPSGSVVDYEQFELHLQRALQNPRADILERILAQYLDDLFPMDRYKEWTYSHRQILSDLRLRGILALGGIYLKSEKYLDALECARQALLLDNWSEDAALLGMQSCIGLKDAPRALRIYREIEKTLKAELTIPPRSDLVKLAEYIRKSA